MNWFLLFALSPSSLTLTPAQACILMVGIFTPILLGSLLLLAKQWRGNHSLLDATGYRRKLMELLDKIN